MNLVIASHPIVSCLATAVTLISHFAVPRSGKIVMIGMRCFLIGSGARSCWRWRRKPGWAPGKITFVTGLKCIMKITTKYYFFYFSSGPGNWHRALDCIPLIPWYMLYLGAWLCGRMAMFLAILLLAILVSISFHSYFFFTNKQKENLWSIHCQH